jgi:hypothetical protein
MSGSEAEERIRAKGEAMLRAVFPSARIVHELVLEQFGVRIDLAAVTTDRLICLEIKSERDVLTRLAAQVEAMTRVSDTWGVLVAAKHRDAICQLLGRSLPVAEEDRREALGSYLFRSAHEGLCNAPARLEMLWADELRAICCPRRAAPRGMCIQAASDSMTGSEIRRAVCSALRARSFPRADPAIATAAVAA